jgi:hypothetical protein
VAKAKWKPRRVRSEEERKTAAAGFIRLAQIGDKFLGHALFDADPKKDDPGYYEYWEHWLTQGRGSSVPCAGDDCPLCEEGDKPKVRANTLWLVLEDENGDKLGDGELRTWTINSFVINALTDLRSDTKIKGRQFRVSRVDDRGNYNLLPKTTMLKPAEIKEWLASDEAPDYEEQLTHKLNRAMEALAIARAVEDDDDEEQGVSTRRSRPAANGRGAAKPARGKGKSAPEPEEGEEAGDWPDMLDGEEVIVGEVDSEGNWFGASSESYEGDKWIYTSDDIEFDLTELGEGQLVTISATQDGDGDYILDSDPELTSEEAEYEEEGEGGVYPGDELPDEISETEFTITSVNAEEETLSLEGEGLEFDLFFTDTGDAANVDFDDYKAGDKVIVSASQDTSGDMVSELVPQLVKQRAARTRKTSAAKSKTASKTSRASSKTKTASKTAARKGSTRKTSSRR